jgi:uncharacterized protein (TIGR03067 family)
MVGDESALQGIWTITSLEVEGSKMADGMFSGAQIVMEGSRFTTVGMGGAFSGIFALDQAARPKTLDLTFTEGPHTGESSYAIYELDGDALTLCIGFAGSPRPTKFATAPGSGHALETLSRETSVTRSDALSPEANPAEPDVAGSDLPDQAECAEEIARLQGDWEMVSGAMGGQPFPPEFAPTGRRQVRGDLVTVALAGQQFLMAKFAVDPMATPKSMDYVLLAGPAKGKAQLGIYALDGETLRVCSARPGRPRPAEFASSADNECTLSVWRKRG